MAGAGGIHTGNGVTVVMDPAPLVYVKVFHSGSGPDRHIKRTAQRVAIMASLLAPVKTGRLASSIHATQNRNEAGTRFAFGYKVYTTLYYAGYVHEGTGPSPRWPVNRKVMKFTGREGFPVYRDFVMHPGTPAQPFLQNALVAMVR